MQKTITVGQIELSFHKAAAAVFIHVLDYLGYRILLKTAPHTDMFKLQQNGEIDLLISAWLPGSHSKYLSPYEDSTTLLAPIYEPYCIWGVPNYIPQNMLKSVSDLAKPEISSKMDKLINGIGAGAGISRFSLEIIEAYGLGKLGYSFKNHAEEDFFELVENRFQQSGWFIIPLWQPQYLLKKFNIRPLEEPLGLLRGKDAATPVLLKSYANTMPDEHLRILHNIYLGNEAETAMDFDINSNKLSAADAALNWIKNTHSGMAKYVDKLKK